MGWHVIGASALAFGRLPDDVVIEHIRIVRGFQVDATPQRFEGVAHDVAGDAGIRILVVEPDGFGVDQVPDNVVAQQAVLGHVQFNSPRLPGELDILPANILDEVRLDQCVLDAHPREAAHTGVHDVIPAHDAVTNVRRRPHVPVLGADVERHAIGVPQDAIFDDPVVPSAGGNHAALRAREGVGPLLERPDAAAGPGIRPLARQRRPDSGQGVGRRDGASIPSARAGHPDDSARLDRPRPL